MSGALFRTTFLSSRYELVLICASLFLYVLMIISLYPSIEGTMGNQMDEGANVRLERMENGSLNLTWDLEGGMDTYIPAGSVNRTAYVTISWLLSEGGSPPLDAGELTGDGAAENFSDGYGIGLFEPGGEDHVIIDGGEPYRVFWVFCINGSGGVTVSDMVSVEDMKGSSVVDEYLRDSGYLEVFAGGADVSFATLDGFVLIELFSLMPVTCAVYFGVKGLSTITGNVENRSMDILLATGYTRRRFLLERTAAILAQMALLLVIYYLSLVAGYSMAGKTVPCERLALVIAGGVPFILAFIAIGTFISTTFNEYQPALGATLGVAVLQYMFQIIANLGDSMSALKWLTLFTFWDTSELMLESNLSAANFLVLSVVAALVYCAALVSFDRKDIPA